MRERSPNTRWPLDTGRPITPLDRNVHTTPSSNIPSLLEVLVIIVLLRRSLLYRAATCSFGNDDLANMSRPNFSPRQRLSKDTAYPLHDVQLPVVMIELAHARREIACLWNRPAPHPSRKSEDTSLESPLRGAQVACQRSGKALARRESA